MDDDDDDDNDSVEKAAGAHNTRAAAAEAPALPTFWQRLNQSWEKSDFRTGAAPAGRVPISPLSFANHLASVCD